MYVCTCTNDKYIIIKKDLFIFPFFPPLLLLFIYLFIKKKKKKIKKLKNGGSILLNQPITHHRSDDGIFPAPSHPAPTKQQTNLNL